jgi:hypothetical protein
VWGRRLPWRLAPAPLLQLPCVTEFPCTVHPSFLSSSFPSPCCLVEPAAQPDERTQNHPMPLPTTISTLHCRSVDSNVSYRRRHPQHSAPPTPLFPPQMNAAPHIPARHPPSDLVNSLTSQHCPACGTRGPRPPAGAPMGLARAAATMPFDIRSFRRRHACRRGTVNAAVHSCRQLRGSV